MLGDDIIRAVVIDIPSEDKYDLELLEQRVNAYLHDYPTSGAENKVHKIKYSIQPTNIPDL